MNLRHHSLSLAVKDIIASKAFYEHLGFVPIERAGSIDEKWIIMQNRTTKIGLFQDIFEENIITFNPDDARTIYKTLQDKGIESLMESPTINEANGPCHFCIADPDGNQILFDQF